LPFGFHLELFKFNPSGIKEKSTVVPEGLKYVAIYLPFGFHLELFKFNSSGIKKKSTVVPEGLKYVAIYLPLDFIWNYLNSIPPD